jgi:hypothetical protein
MMARLFGATAAALLLAISPMAARAATPISRAQLEQMFSSMRSSASWNVDGRLLWGYFFTGTDRSKIDHAAAVLVDQGYRLVEVHRDNGVWWLHVERVERHTVDSLNARNAELYAFARDEGLSTYDGMDVGPVP